MSDPRNRYLLLLDAVLLGVAAWLAFLARFAGEHWPAVMGDVWRTFLFVAVPAKLFVLWRAGVYGRLWRYAGVRDLEVLSVGVVGAALVGAVAGLIVTPLLAGARVPIVVLAVDALLTGAVVATTRLLVRVALRRRRQESGARRAVIVGAGAAGALIVREVLESPRLHVVPVAFVDDDLAKQGRTLHGVKVAGRLSDLGVVIESYRAEEVIIAMPSAPGGVVRDVVRDAAASGVPTRTVPGLFELIQGHKSVSALRKVAIEDLLRRDPVETDLDEVSRLAAGKVVMVTGAGGSIGSELCRQIARLQPLRLIAVGRGENSVFELLQELHVTHPELTVEPVIADVRDRARLERVFRAYRPSTVFHAAAHKHVPLMEQNVSEAILNNVLGTQVVGELADKYGAERFVLISSDKAVRPSSVMGATKRLAEGVIQMLGERSECRFVAVRFGNVLGSRGSVIPTFLRQIQTGGPITITHPEMRRYFMTIPEAVQLVLQAGVMGEGGEVFVLDMGEPVRVLDLAKDLIRLSGLIEGQDVAIRFTGMRPGEKLYEELFFGEENATRTDHPKVLRARNAATEFHDHFTIQDLVGHAQRNAPAEELRRGIRVLVPEYTGCPGEDVATPAPVALVTETPPKPSRGPAIARAS
ncbi:MAG TPA: nucleoside-diphosphate sugar epimerase/dehydratase [Gemmatirosa sp.]|nr:nucleoside-diphosphate sugar epimerase/dehydratase [Gemmatirosa sp.]